MRTLRTTTAILAASLAAQGPVFAQSAPGLVEQLARDAGLQMCDDASGVPCVTEDGALRIDQPDMTAGLETCTEGGPLPCVTAEGYVEVDAASEMAMPFLNGETAPTAEEPSSDEATVEAVEEAPAEETVEATPEPEAAPSQEDAEATAEEAPVEETVEAAPEEAPAEETVEAAPEEVPAEETVEAAPEEAPADETVEATEAAPEEAPADETVEAAPEEAPAEETVEAAPEDATEETATAETEEDRLEKAQRQIEEAAERAVDRAMAAATAAEGDAEATVAEEEVTEETSRSASEEFATDATGGNGGGGGLSDFEKALIVGLGAVAVGSILNNGDEVVSNSGDRVVLQDDQGNLKVLKNDDALLRQPGSDVRTETFADGSTRTVVTREDDTRIVTIRAADGRVVKRSRQFADGTEVILFDDTQEVEPVQVSELPEIEERTLSVDTSDEDALRAALARAEQRDYGRRFSLNQIREIRAVRDLAPEIELDAVTFATGSAAISPSQAEELSALGRTLQEIIDERPGEVFLIEGHTDAVGNASYNLALSDRRAETVALALTEYFDVPPENLVTQGYGESELKIRTEASERENRRATVRRITPLLRMASN